MTDWITAQAPRVQLGAMTPILTRIYKGHSLEEATQLAQQEAPLLVQHGYRPVTQSWAGGQWDGWLWVAAAVLVLFFFVGLAFLAYLFVNKPLGTLTVTYQYAGQA